MREGMKPVLMTTTNPDLMTVTEVADYLRVRERTIYELVRTQRIPSCKLSGKLLFPKRLVELWVAQSADYPQAQTHLAAPPPVIAGSHDPLLEWAARESKCGLAILVEGSTSGMHSLMAGHAVACGLHLIDPITGDYNASGLTRSLPGRSEEHTSELQSRRDLVCRLLLEKKKKKRKKKKKKKKTTKPKE